MPILQPPTANRTPIAPPGTTGLAARLFRHYRPLKKGITLLKSPTDGWYLKEYPTQEEIDVSLYHFLGGHVYTISDALAAELDAEGFGSLIS